MLKDRRILAIVDDVYEDLELWYPKIRLEEEGVTVVVTAPTVGIVHGKHGYPTLIKVALEMITDEGYDALLLPGGFAPDTLRRREDVKYLTRQFAETGRLVAFICHGGWIPISAKVLRGIKATGSRGIKDDLENAGAIWIDEPVVVDQNFISSRTPDDLGYFAKAIVNYLGER